MNFDYDLIERIGATHYDDSGELLYRVDGFVVEYFSNCRDGWRENGNPGGWLSKHLKPIPPRPQVEYTYELVVDKDFWELRDEFDAGELFNADGTEIECVTLLSGLYVDNAIYRRKEVKKTWAQKVVENVVSGDIEVNSSGSINMHGHLERDDAIKLARAILKATGESI